MVKTTTGRKEKNLPCGSTSRVKCVVNGEDLHRERNVRCGTHNKKLFDFDRKHRKTFFASAALTLTQSPSVLFV